MKDEAQLPTPINATLTLGMFLAPCLAHVFAVAL